MNTTNEPTADNQTVELLGINVHADRIANPKIRQIIAERVGERYLTGNYTETYKEHHQQYNKYDRYDKYDEYSKYDKHDRSAWGLWRETPPRVEEAPKCNTPQ